MCDCRGGSVSNKCVFEWVICNYREVKQVVKALEECEMTIWVPTSKKPKKERINAATLFWQDPNGRSHSLPIAHTMTRGRTSLKLNFFGITGR